MMRNIGEIADVKQGMTALARKPGMLPGMESLYVVESADLQDTCWVPSDGLKQVEVHYSAPIERHLLKPFDVLVTARAGAVQAALVPSEVSQTVASVTLLVVRPHDHESGMGHFLWYFLTSIWGQTQLQRKVTVSTTMTTLSATNLGSVELPIPPQRELDRIATLVEAAEEAYARTVEAARLRREAVRDSIIGTLGSKFAPGTREIA